ncbi:MAG TPA: 16S rRNA (adenine(1518)-N(6)/adenine(1519)-N(6))-dimethyltransferase RsmA [Polyangia bacterium]|nr:16S rRNA (adenine(1518)-N(6)/adenine(1519)-N(6))-dimethyltransferase RsmA [Polyangia bacterium]
MERVDDPRRVLARHGLRAKKSWGQNFLHDRSVHARIVAAAACTADDVVVEIGAGLGTLTAALAAAQPPPARVIALERDADMLRVLEAELGAEPRVAITPADAAAFDFAGASRAAGRPIVVVGNLPYQIASALVVALVEARGAIARAVVMVQREFAQRVVAPPGGRTYGRLSVTVQQHAEARILFHVPPGAFHPPPAVISSVMRLVPRGAPLAPVRDEALFAEVVKQAFSMRRKMLRRALEPAFGEAAVARALAAAGIDETLRAERLSVADFARLADALAIGGGARA